MQLFRQEDFDNSTETQWIIELLEPEKKIGEIHVLKPIDSNDKGVIIGRATPIELESELKVGDTVMFSNIVGNEIIWNKKPFLIVKESEILGIIQQ